MAEGDRAAAAEHFETSGDLASTIGAKAIEREVEAGAADAQSPTTTEK